MATKIAPPHFFIFLTQSPNQLADWARNVSTSLAGFFHVLTTAFNDMADEVNANVIDIATLEGRVRSGSGSPEGVVTAPVGTLFLRTNGGAGTTLYVKESGAGNTGWVAK